MSEIIIEKHIPLPQKESHNNIYPFKKMEAGDSILVTPKNKGRSAAIAFRGYINYNRLDWKVQTRVEGDGIRLWRIS